MSFVYLATPFVAWFVTGVTKFLINSLKEKKLAFSLIGYGGMPSNHSAIVISMVSLIGFRDGIDNAAFGVAITLAYIVLLDARSLRKQIEKQAIAINKIADAKLRERIGHSVPEIVCGCIVGAIVGLAMSGW
ncbi:divergent PAP2 family protein [Pantoea sp. B65]|uniref:divergent PAP2 family protein n=1 Tax=Pantoea sp. B65 TaxID=2813359 RepID=UPI0039B541B2